MAYCRPPSAVNISAAASLTGLRVLMATLLTSGSNAWRLREPHRVAKHIGFVSLPLSVVCLRVCYHALRFLSLLSSLASGWLPLRLPPPLAALYFILPELGALPYHMPIETGVSGVASHL